MSFFKYGMTEEDLEMFRQCLRKFGMPIPPNEGGNDMSKHMISVDWDYFFPIDETGPDWPLYDWGHREAPFFIQPAPLWYLRAAEFKRLGKKLPGLSEGWRDFWGRLRNISTKCELYIAESHCRAFELANEDISSIVSFDAHHDLGYGAPPIEERDSIDCSSWLAFWMHLYPECNVTVRYPTWRNWKQLEPAKSITHKDEGKLTRRTDKTDEPFGREYVHRIFICRSGAWVPPWLDHSFCRFVDIIKERLRWFKQSKVIYMDNQYDLEPRDWKPEIAELYAQQMIDAFGDAQKQ